MNRILKIIDRAIFKKIDQIRTHPSYQKILENLSNIPEELQGLVNYIITFVIIISPLSVIVFMFFQVNHLESDLTTKSQILELTQKIINKSDEVKKASRMLIAPRSIEKKADMVRLVSAVATGVGIPSAQLRVQNFESTQSSPNIVEAKTSIVFNNLTLKAFASLIQEMENKQKMRISGLEIQKNQNLKFLNGTFWISHFGKIVNQEGPKK